MATSKSAKIQTEIEKVKAKITEQQARLKELEQKKMEAENTEIVDIVRGLSISLDDLPALLSLIVAPLMPALLLRGSLNVTGEKRFGLRPAFYDLAQPFRWWRRKWQRFRYRHDFVRKQ